MKRLKLFEEYSEKLYSVLSDEEFNLLMEENTKFLTFSDKEINNLIDQLNSIEVKWTGKRTEEFGNGIVLLQYANPKFYVFKDNDDYYYLIPYHFYAYTTKDDGYKCDGIAGIIQLFEEVPQ